MIHSDMIVALHHWAWLLLWVHLRIPVCRWTRSFRCCDTLVVCHDMLRNVAGITSYHTTSAKPRSSLAQLILLGCETIRGKCEPGFFHVYFVTVDAHQGLSRRVGVCETMLWRRNAWKLVRNMVCAKNRMQFNVTQKLGCCATYSIIYLFENSRFTLVLIY